MTSSLFYNNKYLVALEFGDRFALRVLPICVAYHGKFTTLFTAVHNLFNVAK